MHKTSLFISIAVAGVAVFGSASHAKADMIKITAKVACSPSKVLAITLTGANAKPKVDVGHVSISFYDSSGRRLETRGMWEGGVQSNTDSDQKMANGVGCGLASRTAIVDSRTREWAQNQVATAGGTNCHQYSYVYKNVFDKTTCTCVNFATRVWRQVTGDQEQWQSNITPNNVRDKIYSVNGNRPRAVVLVKSHFAKSKPLPTSVQCHLNHLGLQRQPAPGQCPRPSTINGLRR